MFLRASFSNLMTKLNPIQYLNFSKPLVEKNNDSIHSISAEFTQKELLEFYALASKELIHEGQLVFHENDEADAFYIILEGEAEVYVEKNDAINGHRIHVLATLKKDDVIGDMALIEDKPRSASLRAKSELSVLKFNLKDVKQHPQLRLLLTRNLAKILSERLRFTNQITIKNMEENLEQAQARNVLGVFMVAMFWLISLYTLSLTSLIKFEKYLSNSTFLSVGLIFFFAVGILSAMRLTKLPLSRFGITSKDWQKQVLHAVLYTLPIMFVFFVLKMYLVYFCDNPHHINLFSGTDEGVVDGLFSLKLYLSVVCMYALLSPIQELVARCALQSTFFYFLPGNETFRTWNAIILSNLIFASVHSHLSLFFASLTFLPGLFWGWLFNKQRSYIGVSVSHILLGVWVIFIIGGKGLVY